MATILFELGHPKHYLQFRHPIRQLRARHNVAIAAREKDVLLDLLRADGEAFIQFAGNRRGLARKLTGLPAVLSDYAGVLRRVRPDLIVSRSSPYAAVIGRFHGARTMVFPDSEGVPLNEHIVVPLSTFVTTPASFERSYGRKHARVGSMFEAGYLHPDYYQPDPGVRSELGVGEGERFAVVRFVGWTANHDVRRHGFATDEKVALVRHIAERMKVFVSSETRLPPELDSYRMALRPSRIHDALAAASLYVGDSQTMATEAALLGTPSVRYNSFVGDSDFSNFRNLEERYRLLFNEGTFAECLARAVALASDTDAKATWIRRRAAFFADVGDLNMQTVEIIESCFRDVAPATASHCGVPALDRS